ncbi:MAG: hypothetical protein E6417_17785, partial [Bradyrhizobium sp.]|nr:hypothetical protein [Bradyrhizobium sp.]
SRELPAAKIASAHPRFEPRWRTHAQVVIFEYINARAAKRCSGKKNQADAMLEVTKPPVFKPIADPQSAAQTQLVARPDQTLAVHVTMRAPMVPPSSFPD